MASRISVFIPRTICCAFRCVKLIILYTLTIFPNTIVIIAIRIVMSAWPFNYTVDPITFKPIPVPMIMNTMAIEFTINKLTFEGFSIRPCNFTRFPRPIDTLTFKSVFDTRFIGPMDNEKTSLLILFKIPLYGATIAESQFPRAMTQIVMELSLIYAI